MLYRSLFIVSAAALSFAFPAFPSPSPLFRRLLSPSPQEGTAASPGLEETCEIVATHGRSKADENKQADLLTDPSTEPSSHLPPPLSPVVPAWNPALLSSSCFAALVERRKSSSPLKEATEAIEKEARCDACREAEVEEEEEEEEDVAARPERIVVEWTAEPPVSSV